MKSTTTMLVRCPAVAGIAASTAASGADWPSAGHDLKNSRSQPGEKAIHPGSVKKLVKKWEIDTDGDVTAHPAVEGDFLYVPDSIGSLHKVNRHTGALARQKAVALYTGNPGDSPAAPSHHFGDAAGLLTAVPPRSFEGLAQALEAGDPRGGADPVAAQLEQGLTEVDFALRRLGRLGRFRLLCSAGRLHGDPELARCGEAAFEALARGVRRVIGVAATWHMTRAHCGRRGRISAVGRHRPSDTVAQR